MKQKTSKPPFDLWYFGYEWKTKAHILGLPLVHIALGRDRETGKLLIAKGVIAIGQFAIGVVALGQFSVGILAAFGQFSAGLFAVAQFAVGILFGIGQFATGAAAVGQFAFGKYVLAQFGWGEHVWSTLIKDITAIRYFKNFL